MTAETDLLPLPPEDDDLPRSGMWNGSARTGSDPCWLRESVEAYARACVSSATEAARANLAELQREVEGLREYKRISDECNESLRTFVKVEEARTAAAEARAERLAEALRDALECGDDGDWEEARRYIAAAINPTAAQENDDA